jgi:putative ABC transport system ATP-binding protein
MAYDRELNIVLFGLTQTSQFTPAPISQARPPSTQPLQLTQFIQTSTYIKLSAYLIGILGLILIAVGILLEPKGKPLTEASKPPTESESSKGNICVSNAALLQPLPPCNVARAEGGRNVIIRLDSVTKVYSGDGVETPALRGVSLEILEGEFVAIVGPSGSGKSTLLHIMGGLDKPTSGKVYIDGVDISKLSDKDLAELRNKKIGFVFQAFNLISRMDALNNVAFPLGARGTHPKIRKQLALRALQLVGLGEEAYRTPSRLSGGEQQRVAVARALVTEAPILLCDEPTGNLDTKNTRAITELLYKLNKEHGKTVVVITHNMEVAKAADRILFIRDGRIEREERLRGV